MTIRIHRTGHGNKAIPGYREGYDKEAISRTRRRM